MFIKDRDVDETKSYWHCKLKRNNSCKARLTLENDVIKNEPKEHNHLSNETDIERKSIKNHLKRKMEEDPTVSSIQVYNKVRFKIIIIIRDAQTTSR
jgi:hypothetical protein